MLLFFRDKNPCFQLAALQARKIHTEKRALLFASFPWIALKTSKAGITVEAALVLPVFLFTLLWFPHSLIIMGTQVRIQYALEQAAMEIAQHGQADYLPDVAGNITNSAYGSFRLTSLLGHENIKNSCIKNGVLLVVDTGDEEFVELTAAYAVGIPFFPNGQTLWLKQKSRRRMWWGNDEDVVYITRTGSVYHLYLDCSYIRHNPREVSFSTIESQQNSAGSRYTPCHICCKGSMSYRTVYITTEGEHYHSSVACSGICKEVIAIPVSEVGERPLCKRCEER